jgi:hypothetical protein
MFTEQNKLIATVGAILVALMVLIFILASWPSAPEAPTYQVYHVIVYSTGDSFNTIYTPWNPVLAMIDGQPYIAIALPEGRILYLTADQVILTGTIQRNQQRKEKS